MYPGAGVVAAPAMDETEIATAVAKRTVRMADSFRPSPVSVKKSLSERKERTGSRTTARLEAARSFLPRRKAQPKMRAASIS
jgi:hypothetical protein